MDDNQPEWPAPSAERAALLVRFLRQWNLSAEKIELFDQALTHASFAFENNLPGDNERLEFLGDSVLGFVVARWLFESSPLAAEGNLSRKKASLVSRSILGRRAREMGLEEALRLGKGESRNASRHRTSLLGSSLEALVGAVYLTFGMDAAQRFVIDHIAAPSQELLERPEARDYKSAFQELVQKRFRCPPQYITVGEFGPDHEKNFRVQAVVGGRVFGEGEGRRKKDAENLAAQIAVEYFQRAIQAETGGGSADSPCEDSNQI
ncbi:MAG: Ribonuclease 3 [candidate division BRC1 bacterium ADurb.BinA364]|nr:MAG: Ribonuclease 3 [candidate division BRC1 bacterium ADurb.BinA364]